MADSSIQEWITSRKEAGASDKNISLTLKKRGYNDNQINTLFRRHHFPPVGFLVFIIGLSFILFLPIFLLSVFAILGISSLATYIQIIIIAIIFGLFQLYVLKKVNASNTEIVMAGLIVPLAAIFIITGIFGGIDNINTSFAERVGTDTMNTIGTVFVDQTPSWIITTLLIYIIINLFTIINAFRDNDLKSLLWLFLSPLFYGIAIGLGILFSKLPNLILGAV